jgi:prepilin-type N-terminal cleavage/methylation domain-containing protein
MKGRMNQRSDGGFTLFELLLVIIILAVLAGIVAFTVGATRTNSLSASCSSDAKAFGTALEEYKALVGVFPGATALQVPANPTTNPNPQPLPNQGQVWGLTTQLQALQLPGTYGLLGDPSTPNGTWTAPNGEVVGPFMRQLPSTQHYQIVTDGQGGVFVYPYLNSGAPINTSSAAMDNNVTAGHVLGISDTNLLNFETDPGICSDPNVVS